MTIQLSSGRDFVFEDVPPDMTQVLAAIRQFVALPVTVTPISDSEASYVLHGVLRFNFVVPNHVDVTIDCAEALRNSLLKNAANFSGYSHAEVHDLIDRSCSFCERTIQLVVPADEDPILFAAACIALESLGGSPHVPLPAEFRRWLKRPVTRMRLLARKTVRGLGVLLGIPVSIVLLPVWAVVLLWMTVADPTRFRRGRRWVRRWWNTGLASVALKLRCWRAGP
ncbi:hypothetical protein [Tahibacter amnicola]|uniref:Uncharacterized protein n=1 Tax=Tahibacter amnicola TaxID=2976241 RepID=A0ABY6B9M6_9GAMM|nr:hypothetical protein [Tahibacter amnicola]UXI66768.1 hypothetical protein N4264_18715 [Tahibacter amnicola]